MTAPSRSPSPQRVVAPRNPHDLHNAAYDLVTRQAQARRIPDLLALPFSPEADAVGAYLAPPDTLIEAQARRHGVTRDADAAQVSAASLFRIPSRRPAPDRPQARPQSARRSQIPPEALPAR